MKSKFFLTICLLVFHVQGISKNMFCWGIGPHITYITNSRTMFGLNTSLCYSLKNRIQIKAITYISVSMNGVNGNGHGYSPSENTLVSVANISLLPGYQIFDNGKIRMNVFCGLSYGEQNYRAEYLGMAHSSWFGYEGPVYNDKKSNYFGLHSQLSCVYHWQHVGVELFIFENYKEHPETGLGINILVGKLK